MPEIEENLKKFVQLLEKAKKQNKLSGYMLIGGLAVSARSKPRSTEDIDFLIAIDENFIEKSLPSLIDKMGYKIKIMKGSFDDPVRGLAVIFNKDDQKVADMIPANFIWQDEMVKNAEYVELSKDLKIPIATTEDLIILKLKAGGPKDLMDIEELLNVANISGKIKKERLLDLAKRARVDKKLTTLLKKLKISI